MNSRLAQWTAWVTRHAAVTILAIAILTVAAGWYTASNLSIVTSTTDMISRETPFRRNAIAFDKAFPQFSNLIVAVIDAPSPDSAQAAARALVAATQERKDLFVSAESPVTEAFFQRNGLLFQDLAALENLADRLARAEPFLAALAHQPDLAGLFGILTEMLGAQGQALASDKAAQLLDRVAEVAQAQAAGQAKAFSWQGLFDADPAEKARQLVIVRPVMDKGAFSPAAAALQELRRLARGLDGPQYAGTVIRLTGSAAIDHEELQSVELGGKTAGLLSLALVIVLLTVGLRSLRLIVPTLAVLVTGLIWTAAFAALTIGHLNLISVAFAVLFIGLGVDFSIHYCLRFRELSGTANPLPAAGATVGASLAVAALCAAIGFLSFLPTRYDGLAELGLISAGGMGIAFVMNMTLLPALLAVLVRKPFPPVQKRSGEPPSRRRHAGAILVLAGLAAALAAGATPLIRFDFNPMNLKDPASESVAAFLDLTARGENGVYTVDVLAAGPDEAAARIEQLRAIEAVGRIVSFDSFIPAHQEEKLAVMADMAFFLQPVLFARPAGAKTQPLGALQSFQSRLAGFLNDGVSEPLRDSAKQLHQALKPLETATQAAELEKRLTIHLPAFLDNLRLAMSAQAVAAQDVPERLRSDWISPGGTMRIQGWPKEPIENNAGLREFAAAVLGTVPAAVGTPVTITEAGTAVVEAFQQATLLAFLFVTIMLFIALRRVADVVLVLAPLILAALLTCATTVALGLAFNFANVIVLPLLFGLGVASGIHLILRRRLAGTASELMRGSTPRAVLYSALTTIASFGSLALSGHRGMTSMGQLLTIAIVYTLICTLVVLPALMTWLEQRRA